MTISSFKRSAAGVVAGLVVSTASFATGLATCDSGAKSGWQAIEKLEALLKEKGYSVRRIKEDGSCYEAYTVDAQGKREEQYFHPVTLQAVPTDKPKR